MAVAQVKPSRWTFFFFGGLFLVLVGRFVWNRREQVAFVQEAPVAHTTRRLLRCVLGHDFQRMLDDRTSAAGNNVIPSWNDKIEDRLRRIAATYASRDWPSRCIPMAEHLEIRLVSEAHAMRAHQAATDVHQILVGSASSPLMLLRDVEAGSLANSLAALAYEVSGLTAGAEEGWNSPLGPTATDLLPVRTITFPHAAPVPGDADAQLLAMPDLLVYQSRADRRLHRVTFDASERGTDRALGRGSPVPGDSRDGMLRVASDEGDALFVPGAEPAAVVALPEPVRRGVEAIDAWQALLTPTALVWASDTQGVVRVRSTPRSGEPHWSEALTTTGAPDEIAALMLVPGENGAVRLAALRRGANSLALTIREIASEPRNPDAPGADANPGGEWSTFDPHVTSCVAEHTRYLLVSDRFAMRAYALHDDGAVAFQDVRLNALGAPAERRFDLRCNDTAALLFADFEQRADALVVFDFESEAPHVISPPAFGAHARVAGAALTRDHVALAVANDATVRVYRASLHDVTAVPDESATAWTGGTLLAMITPGDPSLHREARTLDVVQFVARDEQIALLARVTEGTRTFVGRLASRDGGATFRGD